MYILGTCRYMLFYLVVKNIVGMFMNFHVIFIYNSTFYTFSLYCLRPACVYLSESRGCYFPGKYCVIPEANKNGKNGKWKR